MSAYPTPSVLPLVASNGATAGTLTYSVPHGGWIALVGGQVILGEYATGGWLNPEVANAALKHRFGLAVVRD